MNTDLHKEKQERKIRFDKVRRSRNFLFYIWVMILLAIGAATYSFFFNVETSVIEIFIFVDAFAVVLFAIYWYLQVRPIYIDEEFFGIRRLVSNVKDKIDSVIEIEEALSIYDETEGQESELARYISNRLDVFPNDSEFREEGRPYNSFDQQILSDQMRLRLFKASLNTLKNRLLVEQDSEEEKTKALSVEESEKEKSIERISNLINLATTRLKLEIEVLSKRANIYIAFGSAITLAAGVVLYFTVQDILNLYPVMAAQNEEIITTVDVFSMATSLSIVVFIEIFAFYYLRLYRNLIEDIKFYQNEITNIEMKILSIYVAETDKSKGLLVSELAKTERNFIISNKQTTIDLERRKKDFDVLKSSTDSIVKIIKSAKS